MNHNETQDRAAWLRPAAVLTVMFFLGFAVAAPEPRRKDKSHSAGSSLVTALPSGVQHSALNRLERAEGVLGAVSAESSMFASLAEKFGHAEGRS